MSRDALAYGVFELPWWGYLAAALALTHVTIVAVTLAETSGIRPLAEFSKRLRSYG